MCEPSTHIGIPFIDLCTWVFGNDGYNDKRPIYVDASDDSQRISRRDAVAYVQRLVSGLKAEGLSPGDSVCVVSFNNIYYSLLLLAIIGARGCFVGANPSYTVSELTQLLSISKVKYVFAEPEILQTVLSAAHLSKIPEDGVFVFDLDRESSCTRYKSWQSLLNHGEEHWYSFNNENEAKNTPAVLASTSGTTGLPKVAVLSHYHYVAQSIQLWDSQHKPYEIKRLLCLPCFHAFAFPLFHLAPLREGHTTYVMRRFNLEALVSSIRQYQITETAVVTPIVLSLLRLSDEQKEALRCLRMLWSGGAPLSARDQNALCDLCHPDARFAQVWGLTEMGWVSTVQYPEKDETGSVGRLLKGNEASVVDEDGEDVRELGIPGELLVRGPSVMSHYLDNEEATGSTLAGGWLHTGDIGYEMDGKWYLIDRAKDLIKVRGWSVSPAELEQCLLGHPGIEDVAVIGVDSNDGRGELPRAYIVPTPTRIPLMDEEIRIFMQQHLARYKSLDAGIFRIDRIPRSASGKILKPVLRQLSSDGNVYYPQVATRTSNKVGKWANCFIL